MTPLYDSRTPAHAALVGTYDVSSYARWSLCHERFADTSRNDRLADRTGGQHVEGADRRRAPRCRQSLANGDRYDRRVGPLRAALARAGNVYDYRFEGWLRYCVVDRRFDLRRPVADNAHRARAFAADDRTRDRTLDDGPREVGHHERRVFG